MGTQQLTRPARRASRWLAIVAGALAGIVLRLALRNPIVVIDLRVTITDRSPRPHDRRGWHPSAGANHDAGTTDTARPTTHPAARRHSPTTSPASHLRVVPPPTSPATDYRTGCQPDDRGGPDRPQGSRR